MFSATAITCLGAVSVLKSVKVWWRHLSFLATLPIMMTTAHAEITASTRDWEVKPDFGKSEDARREISGAACVQGTRHCIVVNDEKKYAQFFDIDGDRIRPGRVIRLLPDKIDNISMEEIDAEGVHYAPPVKTNEPGYYYVTGSHGLSRKAGKYKPSTFFLFRFPVDPTTGQPGYPYDDASVSVQIERTALLREALRLQPALSLYVERQLDQCGVTVEGLAVQGDQLFLGLRAPSIDGDAFLLGFALADLFKSEVPKSTVKRLPLGPGIGVRDLAAVRNGVLILAGRSLDSDPDPKAPPGCRGQTELPMPTVWWWSGRDADAPRLLGRLPGVDRSEKAETLLVLEETESEYRVLVLFDGPDNGGPKEFRIDK